MMTTLSEKKRLQYFVYVAQQSQKLYVLLSALNKALLKTFGLHP
jgi:hypothetical protein